MAVTAVEARVDRLTRAAARRVLEPDVDVPGVVRPGSLVPDCLLSTADLAVDLTEDQRVRLSREETASVLKAGIRFEAVLTAGFAGQIAASAELTDPRLTFVLHEIGEETRHQRMFQRVLEQIAPRAVTPIPPRLLGAIYRTVAHLTISLPATFDVLVLGGEEIPDLIQKLTAEHDGSDPFLREVSRYHRQEESRHLAFARLILPETWRRASLVDRLALRCLAPRLIKAMFVMLVHPGVYGSVGLPGFATWRAVNRSAGRQRIRFVATRRVLDVLLDEGVLRRGRIPRAWRDLCGVDRFGASVEVERAVACPTCASSLAQTS